MIVCDTGPLVAAAIPKDDRHRKCVDLLTSLHLAQRKILVPGIVAAEVGYLLAREGGPAVGAQFLASLAAGTFPPVDLRPGDYRLARGLVTTYQNLGLGTSDATVVALCEPLKLIDVGPAPLLGRAASTCRSPRSIARVT